MEEYIKIGLIYREHGIKGEVKVKPLTDDAGRYRGLKSCFMLEDGRYVPVGISSVRIKDEAEVIVKLEGCDDRNEAIRKRGEYIFVNRKNAVKLPKGRYFISDLEKCEIISDDKKIARVDEVLQPGANDVFYCTLDNGKRILIPFIKQAVDKIDIEQRLIYLTPNALEEVAVYED